ncbi:disulfide bond formation protein B [Mesorhizobium sp.]|uniref:disulfide bond formation protein B n=1 Tax=Mesorhizobium sp. TaxID=1871066 RepID=UPI000FE2AF7A|nr:disulfide bond formation protein B [Mesorhizobium sp.]RWA71704.1 MAG: disulfide bond formation protein B [Mesorhizobium sp.]RWC01000.1 MAG: disulfide bond formation protein B [Mesorhizobium sp.]RWG81186.1 MAG: disulfide bond formation protein B [Mesorhizobium sp.]RWG88782.1 MAG: disulfide bond formation protein B [Mesorhizobium sp.]RWK09116.1 MAG: disulfide bond formation protein B [Mesorhizobium sp.]
MTATMTAETGHQRTRAALFLAVAMAATVGSALAFQYIGGYIPCHLCLEQRTPYYVGAPLMLLAAVASMLRAPAWVTRGLLAIGGLLMLYGLYLGVYHSGVEWAWWPGPADCTAGAGPVDTGGKGVLDALDKFVPPSCDKAALRILGLSLAGWNAIASLILAAVAFRSALARD